MSFTKLFQPKQNPFGIYIFSPKDNSLILKSFSSQTISLSKLSNYKGEGTYCNSYNYLFISESNNFWVINHSSFQIRYKRMPIVKKNHSIIFVPSPNPSSNEGKIFIVGGDDKKAFYYDLKKNYFLNWAPTNELHIKPALIKIGDYLYLFDSLHQNNFCFERTNLLDNKPKWEKIIPKIDQNIINNFPSQNFAVGLDINNKIVFLGGDNIDLENNNTFIYDINNNEISLSEKGTNDCMNFVDKTFYDIDNNYSVALPEDLYETKEFAIIDKNEQSLIKTNIEENNPCQESQSDFKENKKINYTNKSNINNKINDEPKEFGYYISSCSSEQSKIKAKNDKIKVIPINQKYASIKISTNITRNISNIPIKQEEKKIEEKNIEQPKFDNIETKNIENKENIQEQKIEQIEQNPEKKEGEHIQEEKPQVEQIETNLEKKEEEHEQEETQQVNEQIENEQVNEQEHEKIEEKPQYEEINTDINKNENNNINNYPETKQVTESVNIENNNIYIKDNVSENNEEEVPEQKYEIIDEQENE